MSITKQIDEIASGIADVTLELMEDSVNWQLADFEQDGDDFCAIHAAVMALAVSKMNDQLNK